MKKVILVLLTFVFVSVSFAQNRNIIVLGGKGAKSNNNKRMSSSSKSYPDMAIKVAALNFIAGNLPVCFEKEHNNFALLVGAGPTFRRFYDGGFWGAIFDEGDETYSWGKKEDLNNTFNPFSDDYFDRKKIQYGLGYYFVASPRYYYNEEGLDGPYIGLQLAMSQYNFKSQNYAETAFNKPGRDRFTDMMLIVGGNYGGDRVVFEWFTGAGIRFKDQRRYAYGFDYNTNDLVEGTASIKKASVRFELGLRIGVIF